MKRLMLSFFLLCLPVFGQNLKPYAGTWQASFNAKTFFTLTLVPSGPKLTGTVVHDNFNVDQDGNLTAIVPRDAHEKITIVRPVANGIDIYVHDDTDPAATGHYHLELTGENQGKLSLVLIGPGTPKINSWVVRKKD